MIDVRPMLGPERAALVELLLGLDPDEWDAPTECPAWSVHGIALHVLGDDLSLLSRQRDDAVQGLVLYGEEHPGLGFRALLDGFNEQWVHATRFLSHELTVELLRCSGDWTAAFYGSVDLSAPGEPVGFFAATGASPYWQVIAREFVERWVHQQQIRRALRRPDLGRELLVAAVDVVLQALATHLPGFGAPAGTTVALSVTGVGRWALRREPDAWVPGGGDALVADADVELALDPTQAIAVLSRGLHRTEAAAAFTTTGNPTLAGHVVQTVATFAARP
jgi:uncharacterized protein (TIGR03083 family)